MQPALAEDLASGDVTTGALFPAALQATATIVAHQPMTVAGVAVAREVFLTVDPALRITKSVTDGSVVKADRQVLTVQGDVRSLLMAERVAVNFLQQLSGIATLTAAFVAAVAGTKAQILDTRKTTPGWRALEKYAVRAGGGMNHRMDLRSGVLIKDNHLAAIGGDIAAAVARARAIAAPNTPVEVECDSLAQVEQALAAGADWILLDNMSVEMLRDAVARCHQKATTEASGGVTLDSVRRIAETGVDRISVGALTHSAPALDLALDFEGM